MASCQHLNWALLWAEWSLRSGKAWGAPRRPPLNFAPQYTSLLTKEVRCLRRKVVTSHCVVLWSVCATVSSCEFLCKWCEFLCKWVTFRISLFTHRFRDSDLLTVGKTWFRHLLGREIRCTFSFCLVTGSSSLVLPLWRVDYANSMKRFLRLSETTLHFFCMIKL